MAPTVSVDKCGSNSVDEQIWARWYCTVQSIVSTIMRVLFGVKLSKLTFFSEGFFVCGLGWEGGVWSRLMIWSCPLFELGATSICRLLSYFYVTYLCQTFFCFFVSFLSIFPISSKLWTCLLIFSVLFFLIAPQRDQQNQRQPSPSHPQTG